MDISRRVEALTMLLTVDDDHDTMTMMMVLMLISKIVEMMMLLSEAIWSGAKRDPPEASLSSYPLTGHCHVWVVMMKL